MTWVTIGRYSLPYEAQLDRARLDSEGIEALVADEHTINMQWLYSDAMGGVRLQVRDEDLERARGVLAEDRSDLIEDAGPETTDDVDAAVPPGTGQEYPGGEPQPLRLSPLASKTRKRGFFAALLAFWFGT